MRIIHRYITRDFLLMFAVTLLVFTFVMCAAAIIRAIDLMARGVSGGVIFKVFFYNMPYILSFSIPMSVMTAALLLFSRLSFDGELTAMRSCGISLWQIIAPILLCSVALSGICAYLNNTLAPDSRFARRQALRNLGVEEPMNLLDEGRFVRDFPGLMIYVGQKKRNKVRDIVVYETGPGGIKRHVRASSGIITSLEEEDALLIELSNVRIEQPDPDQPRDPSKSHTLTAERYPVRLDLSEVLKKGSVDKRTKDMTFRELMHIIRHPRAAYSDLTEEQLVEQRMKKLVAANTRLAQALSCFTFALLAIPLGMKSRRKESSKGVAISLLVVFVFYAFLIFATSMDSLAHLRPDLIIWIPVLAAQLAGVIMIHRIN